MIIRVFKARLKPGSEHEFLAGERELLGRTDVDGLLGVSIGRRLDVGALEVITLTVWRDHAALDAFAASDTSRPVFLKGASDLVEWYTLEHFDGADGEANGA